MGLGATILVIVSVVVVFCLLNFRLVWRFLLQAMHVPPEKTGSAEKPLAGKERFIVWLARGFDVGLLPKGPGTWGSLVGIVWTMLLIASGRLDIYLIGTALGIPASIWICERAEKILNQHDPSSVVMDEIIALPICFLPWVTFLWKAAQTMPPVSDFFKGNNWLGVIAIFGLFRLFDIWKPGPIGKIQNLRGGLGVTADDVLAGVATASLVATFLALC